MKNYLYSHWAESTIFIAISTVVLLLSFLSTTPWILFLVWMQFPVYLIHQFEEHVYPGHFKDVINREVFHSKIKDSPLSTEAVFWINILAIWILFPLGAVCAQNISPAFGLLLPVFGMFNATLHILMFIIKRRYNPGLLVSIFLNYPTGIYTIWALAQGGFVTTMSFSLSLLVTILAHAIIVLFVLSHLRK